MAGIRYKGQIFSGAASFGDADHVAYDNSQSGLTATDVQDAVDEVNAKLVESGFEVPKNMTVTVPIGYYQIFFLHSIESVVGAYLWAVGTAWATPIAIKASSNVTITATTSDGNVGTFKWDCDLNPRCVFTRLMQ